MICSRSFLPRYWSGWLYLDSACRIPCFETQSISVNLGSCTDGDDVSPFPLPLETATAFVGRGFLDDFFPSGDAKVNSLIRDKVRLELDVDDELGVVEVCLAFRRVGVAGGVDLRVFVVFRRSSVTDDDCDDDGFLRASDDWPIEDLPWRRVDTAFGDAGFDFIFFVFPMMYER